MSLLSELEIKERKNVMRLLHNCTPLPTVLQQLVFDYLLPSGCTILFGNSKRRNEPICLGTIDGKIHKIMTYKNGAIVYSRNKIKNAHTLRWYSADGNRTIELPVPTENGYRIHRKYICVFEDTMIAETTEPIDLESMYQTLDLSKLLDGTSSSWTVVDSVHVSRSDLIIAMRNRLIRFGFGSSAHFRSVDDWINGLKDGKPIVHDEPEDVLWNGSFPIDDAHVLFNSLDSHATRFWIFSVETGKWKQTPPLPTGYKLLHGSVRGHVVAVSNVDLVDRTNSAPVMLCTNANTWIKANIYLFDVDGSTHSSLRVACIE